MATHKKRRGFSLIEAAIVLAMVGLVIGGIWVAAASIENKRFEKNFMEGLITLHGNVQKYFSQQSACADGSYLGWTDPELVKVIYPKQWAEVDVNGKLHGPSIRLPCPTGANPKNLELIFWAGTGFDGYVCSSISKKIDVLGHGLGFSQFWGTGVYTTCQLHRNWTIVVPIFRNTF